MLSRRKWHACRLQFGWGRHIKSERANRIRYFTNVRWIGLAEFTHMWFQDVSSAKFDLKRRKDIVSAYRASFFRFYMSCGCPSA
jgi:hypothetical protein